MTDKEVTYCLQKNCVDPNLFSRRAGFRFPELLDMHDAKQLAEDPMRLYRAKRDEAIAKKSVNKTYTILGFISSGTYGRVYKVCTCVGFVWIMEG
jgi:hypothetical protein